jgi:hypothetical protein
VDHLSPDYGWDDTVVLYTGAQAHAIDGVWGRTPTFRGGFWQPESGQVLWYDGHGGTDYALPRGTTVLAAAPGEVVFADSAPSGCDTPLIYVALEHENGYRTYYVHLDGVCVSAGDRVQAGDPLGISGNSGCSTGPHLHFGVERGATAGVARLTDPYGWRSTDQDDPLVVTGGEPATWLWAGDAPPASEDGAGAAGALSLTGRLVAPPPDTHANGALLLSFVPEPGSPPLARVEFWAYYTSELGGIRRARWHRVGVDQNGGDGWSLVWDTRGAPEGPVWLHAWAVDGAGNVGKGSPIHDSVTIDRHPPLGRLMGLLPGGVAGKTLWLYVRAEDPESGVRGVELLARPHQEPTLDRPSTTDGVEEEAPWTVAGEAERLEEGEWLLEWTPPAALNGATVDLTARLTDRAGNSALTEPVERVLIDAAGAPLGQIDAPRAGEALTTTAELVFVPAITGQAIEQVTFEVWYDEAWHVAGTDANGLGGWRATWDPAGVEDQTGLRVLARPSSADGERAYTALPQVTGLVLDRTPPRAGYVRPRSEGVARPDVAQRVWASDEGSGVARVTFYADWGEGWFEIGVGQPSGSAWSLAWEAAGVPDGPVDLRAQAVDRAGNAAWTEVQREVALDRTPPEGVLHAQGDRLWLEVSDAGSGLYRAVFYGRSLERGGWRHLGVDGAPRDGLSLRWDPAALGGSGTATFAAWVYDRAGNYAELAAEETLWIDAVAEASPTETPTMTPPPPTATPAPATPTSAPSIATATLTPTGSPAATATTARQASAVATALATATQVAAPTLSPISPVAAGLRVETVIAVAVLAIVVGVVGFVWAMARARR